jgi:hypothetical protein
LFLDSTSEQSVAEDAFQTLGNSINPFK